MFVRNNTNCPNCGKCKTFDFVIDEAMDHRYGWIMRIACIQCDWSMTIDATLEGLRQLFQGVVKHLGWRFEDTHAVKLWNASMEAECESTHLVVQAEKNFIRYLAHSVFQPNVVREPFLEDQFLSKVIEYFVEKPDRKRRYRWDILLRTVGL